MRKNAPFAGMIFIAAAIVLGWDAGPLQAQTTVMVDGIAGSFAPSPAPIDTEVTAQLSAKAMKPSLLPYGCEIKPATWKWTFDKPYTSTISEGGTWTDAEGGYCYAIVSQSDSEDEMYYSSTLSVKAIFHDGFFYKLTFNAEVNFTDTCSGEYAGKGKADGIGTAFDVKIFRKRDGATDYSSMDENNNAYALPGSYIDLKADVKPSGAKVTFKWAAPSSTVFKKYEMAKTKATLTGLASSDLENQTIQFRWADSGTKSVKCKVSGAGGTSLEKTASLTVENLTVDFGGTLNSVVLWESSTKLGPKGPLVESHGADFVAQITLPAGYSPGQWQFVQTIVMGRYQTLAEGGTKQHLDINGKSLLDTNVPYPVPGGTHWTGETVGIAHDTPHSILNATVTRKAADDSYIMYLMFKPAGSNASWVPVKQAWWWWTGTATLSDGKWTLSGASTADSPLTIVDTVNHPIWCANNTVYEWEND